MEIKSYDNYKDSGIEWIGEIPKDWKVEKLKFNSNINKESLPENFDPYYEFFYLDISNVSNKGTIINTELIRFEDAPSRARRIPSKYDTIISTVRTYLKAIAYLDNIPDNFVVSTGFSVLNPQKNIISRYLYYLVSSDLFVQTVVAYSKGIAYPAINSNDLANLPIWYPSTETQIQISLFLDKKTSEIDLTVQKDTRLIELLKEKRTTLINHVVTKGLDPMVKMKDSGVEWIGEIPENWEVKKLKHTSLVSSDKLNKKPKELPYIGLEHIQSGNGVLIGNNVEEVDSSVSRFKKGDILFGKLRPYLAKVIEAPFDGVGTTELVVIRMNDCINSHFAFYQLLSDRFINLVNALTYGVKMPRANPDQIVNISICVPPITEQKEISLFLDKETSKIDNIIQKIQENISLLEEYKKSLIHHVVTGKVDVREVTV